MIKKETILLIVTVLVYSLMAMSYMHKNFPSKDMFDLLKEQLNRIETKVDSLN